MEFEWDERKRQEVLARRGVDLLDAALIFEGEVLTHVDDRKDYARSAWSRWGWPTGSSSSSCMSSGTE